MKLSGFIYAVAALIFAVAITGCGVVASDKKVVSVTIMPQKYFADRISGGLMEVNCVVPSGANPENYDPAPSEIIDAAKSLAYFKVGNLGFEISSLPKIAENNPSMKIYDTSKGVVPLRDHHHPCGSKCSLEGDDPHIWSSPKSAKVMARNILNGFVEIDPQNRDQYVKNYNGLIAEMDSVDNIVSQKLSGHAGAVFAIFHPSLSYFARDYGLKQLTLEKDGKELTASSFRDAIDMAKQSGVGTVFIQSEFNPGQVETFAAEVGGNIIVINPLDYNWVEETIRVANAFE